MINKIATKIIDKYLEKGNMSRCLRDILPSSNLTLEQRDNVAEIVHDVVRWKKLYDYIIKERGIKKLPETYVQLAVVKAQMVSKPLPFDYKYSCSEYVAKILKKRESLAEYLNERPPTTLCVNLNKSNKEEIIKTLYEEKLPAMQSKLETAVLTTSNGRYSSAIKNRYAHVQDESSQLISYMAVKLGNSILDFCAGNGGKSLSMASITKNKKTLHAYDVNQKKRVTIKQRAMEYNANIIVEDELPRKKFDVTLVDAPCTGIGAARRNPEAKYVEEPGDFPKTQLDILENAAKTVNEEGFILYSVCTITPEETRDVVETFSKQNQFKIVGLNKNPYSKFLIKNKYGAFTNIPGGDLFFVSILQK
ncbi:MAG: RsmB/NOP family class I SAM-dependent RNA methyltransferase [Candidatus Thermoplasmatota archaeon]|jgi:16S rRNA (cytosine967-C5)-methyltransferase|nr:RsmB/NOP family class I SAM-dependent RNA methyltransferase [Candidatus Thermoplasmatota archaeon]